MPEIEILTAQRVVTTAGTPEKIKEAPEFIDNAIIAIDIRAHLDNAGNVYVVNEANAANASTVGKILAPGDHETIDVSQFADAFLNLAKIYIDSANDGDGISYTAIRIVA